MNHGNLVGREREDRKRGSGEEQGKSPRRRPLCGEEHRESASHCGVVSGPQVLSEERELSFEKTG